MLYMVSWSIAPENRDEVIRRFAASATDPDYALPEGLTQVARYHDVPGLQGVQILESDDPAKVMEWSLLWTDLLEISAVPVVEDEQAGAMAANALARIDK